MPLSPLRRATLGEPPRAQRVWASSGGARLAGGERRYHGSRTRTCLTRHGPLRGRRLAGSAAGDFARDRAATAAGASRGGQGRAGGAGEAPDGGAVAGPRASRPPAHLLRLLLRVQPRRSAEHVHDRGAAPLLDGREEEGLARGDGVVEGGDPRRPRRPLSRSGRRDGRPVPRHDRSPHQVDPCQRGAAAHDGVHSLRGGAGGLGRRGQGRARGGAQESPPRHRRARRARRSARRRALGVSAPRGACRAAVDYRPGRTGGHTVHQVHGRPGGARAPRRRRRPRRRARRRHRPAVHHVGRQRWQGWQGGGGIEAQVRRRQDVRKEAGGANERDRGDLVAPRHALCAPAGHARVAPRHFARIRRIHPRPLPGASPSPSISSPSHPRTLAPSHRRSLTAPVAPRSPLGSPSSSATPSIS